MRPRIWIIIAAIVLALGFGFTGRATDMAAMDRLSGLAWFVAIITAVTLLPFWARILPQVAPMPGLFRRPAHDERWCPRCGSPTARSVACTVCGAEPKVPVEKAPKQPKKAAPSGKKRAKSGQ